jgi:protein arginine phosphatase
MRSYNFVSDPELNIYLKNNRDFTFLHFTGSMLGIGAPATSRRSIEKINQLKNRSDSKGFIILIADTDWLDDFHFKCNNTQKQLIQQYWPGELTIIFKDEKSLFSNISLNGNVAVRIPGDPFLRKFLDDLGEPVISTSINRTGKKPELDLKVVEKGYEDWFDFKLLPKDFVSIKKPGSTIIDCTKKEPIVIREGSISQGELLESINNPLILFVCTGNICRSPLAEYYTRYLLDKVDSPFQVRSTGFLESGNPISRNSGIILEEMGIVTKEHRSTKIDLDLIRESWIILTMENSHKTELLRLDPNALNKIFTLSEYCGIEYCKRSLDIDDPYGSDLNRYRMTFNLIKERVDCLVKLIEKEGS